MALSTGMPGSPPPTPPPPRWERGVHVGRYHGKGSYCLSEALHRGTPLPLAGEGLGEGATPADSTPASDSRRRGRGRGPSDLRPDAPPPRAGSRAVALAGG